MNKRPRLNEALAILQKYAAYDIDCRSVLEEYKNLVNNGQEFFAARLVVEIIYNYNEERDLIAKKEICS